MPATKATIVCARLMAFPRVEPRAAPQDFGRAAGWAKRRREVRGAYAILDQVRTAGISHPPTVYRALAELIEKGMVHRLQSRAAFIACGHGARDGKFAFAICRECGKVVEIPLSDDDQAALLGLAPEEIVPEQVTLELAGLCAACRPS